MSLILLFLNAVLFAKPLDLTLNAEEAILINAKTGRILFEKNAHKKAFPASTTKIATALYTLQHCSDRLEEIFIADREAIASITPQAKKQSNYRSPPHWLETDGTHIGIHKGEEFILRDLLYALMVASANDAANVIAQNVSGTISHFMEELNGYLREIGCKNTNYLNPHGLHHPEHQTTAYDLSVMAQEALKNPLFREIVSTVRFTLPQTNLEEERHLSQVNKLLKKGPFYYPKAIGIKTGFTTSAGKNLVAAAENHERTLIAVALGCRGPRSELYQDITKMFEAAFHEKKLRRTLVHQGQLVRQVSIPGGRKPLKTIIERDLNYDFYPSEEEPVKLTLNWSTFELPILKGEIVGQLSLVDATGLKVNELPLVALEDVEPTFWLRTKLFFSKSKIWRQLIFVSVAAFLVVMLLGRRKKRRYS